MRQLLKLREYARTALKKAHYKDGVPYRYGDVFTYMVILRVCAISYIFKNISS